MPTTVIAPVSIGNLGNGALFIPPAAGAPPALALVQYQVIPPQGHMNGSPTVFQFMDDADYDVAIRRIGHAFYALHQNMPIANLGAILKIVPHSKVRLRTSIMCWCFSFPGI